MSIPEALRRQRDWSAGQLDAAASRRSDLDIFDKGARKAENVRCLDTGALTRRPGRRVAYFDGGFHDIVRPVSDVVFDVLFAHQRFTARLRGGGIVANITDCPWNNNTLPTISWEAVGNRIFVASRNFRPRYLEYDPVAGTWSLNTLQFRTGISGRVAAPFYRFAALGMTLRPSARTGGITVTASADYFTDDMASSNHLISYLGRQIRVTGVNTKRVATGTVLEKLPPTWRVTVDSTDGFSVGETVEGESSNTVGEIVNVVDATRADIVVSNNFPGFQVDEYIVTDNGRGKVSAQNEINPGASLQWLEQFWSSHRGWPGAVSSDRQRLIFTDHPQKENAIIWSAIDAPDDYDTDTPDAAGAIFDFAPKACRVYQVLGLADQLVLTDAGSFYIPISATSPLTQGAVSFQAISENGAANVRAVRAGDGVVYVDAEQNRLSAIIPTGQPTQPWAVQPLTEFHEELFSAPVSVAVSDGSDAAPGRHLYVVNDDGQVVVGRYREGADYIGWFPWPSEGMVTFVNARFGAVLFSVDYDTIQTVEELDNDLKIDGAVRLSDFEGNDAIQTSTGAAITTSTGAAIVTDAGAVIEFAGTTMYGWADGYYLGPVTISGDGRVEFPTNYIDRYVGWLYTPTVEPFVPTFEGGENFGQAQKRRRIQRALITVNDTQTFLVDGNPYGREFASYQVGEDMGEPRPLRDDTYRHRQLGRSFDPVMSITQPIPGAFTLLEVAMRVTI